MNEDSSPLWRNALIGLTALALLVIGLGIVVYVGIARDRIVPTPTARLTKVALVTTPGTPNATAEPVATVLGRVRDYTPGALIMVVTPIEGTADQVIMPEGVVVIRADGQAAPLSEITPERTIFAEGILDALGRIVAQRITLVEAPQPTTAPLTHTPALTPSATAELSPTPLSQGWQAEYFANRSLDGSPALVRVDPAIDFQWKGGSPAAGLPADGFSVRWRGRWNLAEEGGYRFLALSDDGVRLWVDGALVIDQWRDQAATLSYGDLYLKAGEHQVQVEYYEGRDEAQVRVWWNYQGLYPEWKGEYFPNRNLQGNPAVTRNDAAVRFDWGAGGPAAGIQGDNWSARWTRTLNLEEGAYRFAARADDGIRVWVDGPLIIDEWHSSKPTTYEGYIWLTAGPHQLRVEYLEEGGNASVQLGWEKIETFAEWRAEYYANPDLSGRPAFVRNDPEINLNWAGGSPGYGLPVDNFSVRWSRNVTAEAGRYRFWTRADDGARVYIDGTLLINDWRDGGADLASGEVTLSKGQHTIVVEYYERGGSASMQAGWEFAPTATPTSTLTSTPIPATLTPTTAPATSTATTVPASPTPTTAPATPTATPVPATPTATTAPATPTATSAPASPTPTTAAPTMTPTSLQEPAPPTPTPTKGPIIVTSSRLRSLASRCFLPALYSMI